jgi:hypothetical protein
VTVAQGCIDARPNSLWVAKHVIIPEANHSITLVLDHPSSLCIDFGAVVPAIDLDHQFGAMAGEIGDKVTDRNLSSKMLIRETLAENAPESAFRIRHVAAQAPDALDSAGWRMMLQDRRSSTEITPPLPLPIKGRGSLERRTA